MMDPFIKLLTTGSDSNSKSNDRRRCILGVIIALIIVAHEEAAAGMINCEGSVYSVEDEMINFIMCCGRQLYDARISQCARAKSSSSSHRHFHDAEAIVAMADGRISNVVFDQIAFGSSPPPRSDEDEDDSSSASPLMATMTPSPVVLSAEQRKSQQQQQQVTTPLGLGAPKKPYCTDEDMLTWHYIENPDEQHEPLAYFPLGSIGCCGRRLYRKSAYFCCNSMLYQKSNKGQLCCGGVYYPSTMAPQFLACCNNTLVDIRARPHCARDEQQLAETQEKMTAMASNSQNTNKNSNNNKNNQKMPNNKPNTMMVNLNSNSQMNGGQMNKAPETAAAAMTYYEKREQIGTIANDNTWHRISHDYRRRRRRRR